MNGIAPAAGNVAMVFEAYGLYPHLAVRENLDFPLRSVAVQRTTSDAAVPAVAASTEVAALLERKPHELAAGEAHTSPSGARSRDAPTGFPLDDALSHLDPR